MGIPAASAAPVRAKPGEMTSYLGGSSPVVVLGVTVPPAPLSLDALAANPALATAVPPEIAWTLYQRSLAVLLALLPVLRPPAGQHEGASAAGEDRLLAPRDVAAYLHVAPSRVYELLRSGALPAVKVGRYVRVRATVLHQWVAAHEAQRPLSLPGDLTYSAQYEGHSGTSRGRGRVRPASQQAPAARRASARSGRSPRPRPAPPPDSASDETSW